jgi:hypothetical protein
LASCRLQKLKDAQLLSKTLPTFYAMSLRCAFCMVLIVCSRQDGTKASLDGDCCDRFGTAMPLTALKCFFMLNSSDLKAVYYISTSYSVFSFMPQ